MGFGDAVKACLRKYATFSGRASRPEYWWFVLFLFLSTLVAVVIDSVIFGTSPDAAAPLSTVIGLATLIPALAVAFRRLHDIGRPGWYIFIPSITGLLFVAALFGSGFTIGVTAILLFACLQVGLSLLLLWWLTRPSDAAANRYGTPA